MNRGRQVMPFFAATALVAFLAVFVLTHVGISLGVALPPPMTTPSEGDQYQLDRLMVIAAWGGFFISMCSIALAGVSVFFLRKTFVETARSAGAAQTSANAAKGALELAERNQVAEQLNERVRRFSSAIGLLVGENTAGRISAIQMLDDIWREDPQRYGAAVVEAFVEFIAVRSQPLRDQMLHFFAQQVPDGPRVAAEQELPEWVRAPDVELALNKLVARDRPNAGDPGPLLMPRLALRRCNFTGADFSRIVFDELCFVECSFNECDFSHVRMNAGVLHETQFWGGHMDQAEFSPGEAWPWGTQLGPNTRLPRVTEFRRPSLAHTVFAIAHLNLHNCNLTGTRFRIEAPNAQECWYVEYPPTYANGEPVPGVERRES